MLAEGLRREGWAVDSLLAFAKGKLSRTDAKILIDLANEIRGPQENIDDSDYERQLAAPQSALRQRKSPKDCFKTMKQS